VHALAAAHLGRLETARNELKSLSESIAQQRIGINYAHILHIYWLQAQAAVQLAESEPKAAVRTLKSAVDYERAHPIDYPNILAPPSAEVLGESLLDIRDRASARRAFQQALLMAPNRLRSLDGLRKSK
jgi:tetratricopeptide (TPR) repeat protein